MATLYNPEKDSFRRFDEPLDYKYYLENEIPKACFDNGSEGFYGREGDKSLDALIHGDSENLAAAQNILSQMQDQNIFSEHPPEIVNSVIGFAVDVPAALAGVPEEMYNFEQTENTSNTAPIAIYVETLVSGGVSQSQLTARGIAIMGFVLAMSQIRPVELYTVCIAGPRGRYKRHSGTRADGIVCRIPSKPLALAQACYMLTDASYYRRLAFASMYHESGMTESTGSISWAWGSAPTEDDYVPSMREMLGLQPLDIFLKGGYLFDGLMLNNPVQWVKNMIQEHAHAGMEQYYLQLKMGIVYNMTRKDERLEFWIMIAMGIGLIIAWYLLLAEQGNSMRLLHHSKEYLKQVDSCSQIFDASLDTIHRGDGCDKPNGLWVSVEGPDDWLHWCEDNEFRINYYINTTEIILKEDHNILILIGEGDILNFTQQYGCKPYWAKYGTAVEYKGYAIKWAEVASKYNGIIIAPYVWSCRLDVRWYYGWDCASGCIWNKDAIKELRPIYQPECK